MTDSIRVVRVALPLTQIRAMDKLILDGAGGFENRNEFIAQAVESQILELSYPVADEAPLLSEGSTEASVHVTTVRLEIASPKTGYVVPAESERKSAPLFGLHNRDYPSIWALWRLSTLAAAETVSFDRFLSTVSDEAWVAGETLQRLEDGDGEVITSLFPTNPKKRESAESAFREFAIGSATRDLDAIRTSGPLFEWSTCATSVVDDQVHIGITDAGWALLSRLDGLGPVQPHQPETARAFMCHIQEHSPADWGCFRLVLEMSDGGSPARVDLVEAFGRRLGLSSENTASTYAAGYVARCREWGLLESKQVKGAYVITDLGRSVLEEDDCRE